MRAKFWSCLPDGKERKEERIAISELFDMIAGSETGAIIASSLAVKNKDTSVDRKNAHYADTAFKFFYDYGDVLYRDAFIGTGTWSCFTIIFTLLGAFLGFKLVEYFVTILNYDLIVNNLKDYCKLL